MKNALMLIFLLSNTSAYAFGIKLLHSEKYNNFELEKINTFLQDTLAYLPEKVKNSTEGEITLSFIEFPEDKKFQRYEIIPPNCMLPPDGATEEEIDRINSESRQTHGSTSVPVFAFFNKTKRIEINRLFLNDIFRGKKNSRTYRCGLKNHYNLAMSILLHEIFHIYDSEVSFSKNTQIAAALGFDKNIIFPGFESRNKNLNRRAETYELDDVEEAAAVNFSYFLLDKEYACRRPILSEVYAKSFGVEPKVCKKGFVIPVMSSSSLRNKFIPIDPKKVYGINFLTVTPSSGLGSQMGHTMMQIVTCAPQRPSATGECEKDTAHHLVAAFLADVDDANLDWQRGLGLWSTPYDSVVKIYPMAQSLQQYTNGEWRDIRSQKLNLQPEQMRRLILSLIEASWTYQGEYRFITQNCMSETQYLLKQALPQETAEKLTAWTPMGLSKNLVKLNLSGTINDNRGYTSFKQTYENSFNLVKSFINVSDSSYKLENYLNSDSNFRLQIFERVLAAEVVSSEKSKVFMAMDTLEKIILEKIYIDWNNKILERFYKNLKSFQGHDLGLNYGQTKKMLSEQTQDEDLDFGYGVPLAENLRGKSLSEFDRILLKRGEDNTKKLWIVSEAELKAEATTSSMYANLKSTSKNKHRFFCEYIKNTMLLLPTVAKYCSSESK